MNSTLTLFEAIAKAGKINRAELSRLTGFSLMTVGKAVERLISAGVITEEKMSSGTVGRKFGVCSLTDTAGMILVDIDTNITAYALDISLRIISEREGDDIPTLVTQCLTDLFDEGKVDIIGVAFVVPDCEIAKRSFEIREMLGSEPELIIGRESAFAYANSGRFDYTKTAIFAHVSNDGKVNGRIMQNGKMYVGAHGTAGDIFEFIPSIDVLIDRLSVLSKMLDPELVHIACDNGEACAVLESAILPEAIIECTDSCRTSFDGAVRMLREKYILSKFPNNT